MLVVKVGYQVCASREQVVDLLPEVSHEEKAIDTSDGSMSL